MLFDQTFPKLTVCAEIRNVWKMTFKNITVAELENVLMKITPLLNPGEIQMEQAGQQVFLFW